MAKCAYRIKADLLFDGSGTLNLGGPTLNMTLPQTRITLVDNLADIPAGLQKVGSASVSTERSGPQNISGTKGIEIPFVIDISYTFNLDGYAKIEFTVDLYSDCSAPWCTEGKISKINLNMELWSILGPDGLVGSGKFGFVNEPIWGVCFTPPWKNCCPSVETDQVTINEVKSVLFKDIAEFRISGDFQIEYMVYNKTSVVDQKPIHH